MSVEFCKHPPDIFCVSEPKHALESKDQVKASAPSLSSTDFLLFIQ